MLVLCAMLAKAQPIRRNTAGESHGRGSARGILRAVATCYLAEVGVETGIDLAGAHIGDAVPPVRAAQISAGFVPAIEHGTEIVEGFTLCEHIAVRAAGAVLAAAVYTGVGLFAALGLANAVVAKSTDLAGVVTEAQINIAAAVRAGFGAVTVTALVVMLIATVPMLGLRRFALNATANDLVTTGESSRS